MAAEEEIKRLNEERTVLVASIGGWMRNCKELEKRAEKAEAALVEETSIVSRIWVILGSPTYEELAGRSIYDLVSQAVKDQAALAEMWQALDGIIEAATEGIVDDCYLIAKEALARLRGVEAE